MSCRVAVVTLDGFNEIDSFVVARMVDSVAGLAVELVGSGTAAVSMAGIEVKTTSSLERLNRFDAVVVGSGSRTFEHIENAYLGGQPIGQYYRLLPL